MATDAVQDFLSTIYNEVVNNSQWEFGESRVRSLFTSPEHGVLEITLENGSTIKVTVSELQESKASVLRCPCCQELKPGWPDSWQNISNGRGLLYGCADCAAKKRKPDDTKKSEP